MSGKQSHSFGYNSEYLLRDGRAWFPIMGEMHYSRYPREYWEESLYKMKAGGVDVVSTYVIWIHHEEVEGEYDFEGVKDIEAFAEACKRCGLYLFLRIGPWSHAEVRNGGFPDWLYTKEFEPRTNDEGYFAVVTRLYWRIYEQISGLLHKDGGPIIGIQIENEYGHCGGQTGEAGEAHMERLAAIAREIGFDVPYYTATGWGGAVTGGLLPVMGGYCDAPWDQRLSEIEPSGNYIFTHERNDHNIGSDHGFGHGITFDIDKSPYLTAELGGGLQITHHRRPIATARDIGAVSTVKLGSGVNLLGYYMYHGGTNPRGRLTTLQESRETGYPSDLPVLSYDFRAPLREYGQISETFKEIKLLAMFARDFGEEICHMPAFIPESNPAKPENQKDLRIAIRHNGNSGYVFVNNYQRHRMMAEHSGVVLANGDEVRFPAIDIADGDYFFYPFNMSVRGGLLKTTLATPLCRLNAGTAEETVVFYGNGEPRFEAEGELPPSAVLAISRADALNSYKVSWDREYLIISPNPVLENGHGYEMVGSGEMELRIAPAIEGGFEGFERLSEREGFAVFRKYTPCVEWPVVFCEISADGDRRKYRVDCGEMPSANDFFIRVCYDGDRAELYLDGEMIADHFFDGEIWEIGMKRFGFPRVLELAVYPLAEGAEVYLEHWPDMKDGVACGLNSVKCRVEDKTELKRV